MNEKKIGLFFGSFNPIHYGHLIIASHMAEFGGMERIWFVVSPENPLKDRTQLLHRFDRLDMVNLAIEDDIRFAACDIEFFLPRPSYTIHTLIALKEKHPGIDFHLIMGGDNLQSLDKWKNYEEILKMAGILVYPRPGFDGGAFVQHSAVTHVEAPLMQISSSYIRRCVKEGFDYRYLLPAAVKKYIEKKGFYL
jgi:nicotinate-nucleotide adenylyltransferase